MPDTDTDTARGHRRMLSPAVAGRWGRYRVAATLGVVVVACPLALADTAFGQTRGTHTAAPTPASAAAAAHGYPASALAIADLTQALVVTRAAAITGPPSPPTGTPPPAGDRHQGRALMCRAVTSRVVQSRICRPAPATAGAGSSSPADGPRLPADNSFAAHRRAGVGDRPSPSLRARPWLGALVLQLRLVANPNQPSPLAMPGSLAGEPDQGLAACLITRGRGEVDAWLPDQAGELPRRGATRASRHPGHDEPDARRPDSDHQVTDLGCEEHRAPPGADWRGSDRAGVPACVRGQGQTNRLQTGVCARRRGPADTSPRSGDGSVRVLIGPRGIQVWVADLPRYLGQSW
jgi:hypothetical protein